MRLGQGLGCMYPAPIPDVTQPKLLRSCLQVRQVYWSESVARRTCCTVSLTRVQWWTERTHVSARIRHPRGEHSFRTNENLQYPGVAFFILFSIPRFCEHKEATRVDKRVEKASNASTVHRIRQAA